MKETLVARQAFSYGHRMLTAGQTFEATSIDAGYLVRRGQAEVMRDVTAQPQAAVIVPRETPVQPEPIVLNDVVEEPVLEAQADVQSEPGEAQADGSTSEQPRIKRTYTRRTPSV